MGFLLQFFMNPLFLIGASSASIPIVIHLIHRRKAPKVLFSTLRFLRVSNERTARRQHLQDILLLLLRAMICALLAVALARPFIPASNALQGPVVAAFVLDNSLSMAAMDEGHARFFTAKEFAVDVLRGLGEKASAVLVLTNPPKDQPEPAPTSDLSKVERDIAGSEVSAGKGNLADAIVAARKILDEVPEPNKEIFVFSDLQKNSWLAAGGQAGGHAGDNRREKASKIPVLVMNCGSLDRANAAVTDVVIRTRSRVEGEPVTIEGRLMNFGTSAVNQRVTLYIDGQPRDRRNVTLAPGVPTVASFGYVFSQPGFHRGMIAIEDDRLKTDNVRSFSINVQQQLKVLVVTDLNPREDETAISFLDDTFYLLRALDPLQGLADVRSPIRPARVSVDELEREKLSAYKAIYLVNLSQISLELAGQLKGYVRDGGGLVVFAGERADPKQYSQVLADPSDALMPVEFGGLLGNADDHTRFRRVAEVDYSHRLLARFKGEGIFGDVRVYQNIAAKVAGKSASALISLGDGSPLLIENSFGNGKVLMFTSSATVDWSNLPIRQAYLPLLHEITYYVSRKESMKESYLVGSAVRLNFPAAAGIVPVEVTDPSGKVVEVRSQPPVDSAPGTNTATIDRTSHPGIYTWRASAARQEALDGSFAVNPDTAESDLLQAGDADVYAASDSQKVFVVATMQELDEKLKGLREGFPLIDYFFLIVLGIAVFECFFSNWLTPDVPQDVKKSKLGLVSTQAG